MSNTPKVKSTRVVPWDEQRGLFGIDVVFDGGRKNRIPVGDRKAAKEHAWRAREVPEFTQTIWANN